MNDDKLYQVVLDIYKEAFLKAEPSVDFQKVRKTKDWFFRYHLAPDIQHEIVERHIRKHRLKGIDAMKVRNEAHLGCLPCSCEYMREDHKVMK
jgi:hypothetical protein